MNEAALKDRLKKIAKEQGKTLTEVLKQFLLERFLARIAASKHQEHFIFKVGLLLSKYLPIGRETVDADFLLQKMNAEEDRLQEVLTEIATIELNDLVSFSFFKIEELTQPHMNYPGFRITLSTQLGNMKDKIHIDIGVGDTVSAQDKDFPTTEYKGNPLFTGEITLLAYPIESIFAEKIETIISKGSTNSRLKDFHDAYLIQKESALLDPKKTSRAINSTFKTRETKVSFPITFDEDQTKDLQQHWSRHLRGLPKEKVSLPENISDVISAINEWLEENYL